MKALVRRLWKRPWLTSTMVVVVLVGAGVGGYLAASSGAAATSDPSYRLVAAALGTIRESLSTTGTIEPAVQDDVNFQVAGEVTSVRVSAGQSVAKGAVLATVNSASLQSDLAQANATLASDQARLTSDTDAGADSTTISADNSAITAAQGQVSAAQTALSEATLTSPIAGVVASVNLTVGQQVSASSGGSGGSGSGGSGSGGTGSGGTGSGGTGSGGTGSGGGSSSSQFLVISTDSWVVDASVDDTQVGLLANGDQAQVVPDGATSTAYGTIGSVGLIASDSSGVASYPVVVDVTGNPSGLHPGATATLSLIYRQLANVLEVPTAAVHIGSSGTYVDEMSGTKVVTKTVTTGLASGGETEITAGLSAGDEVEVAVTRTPGRTGSTSTNRGRTGFGGGLGGGGFGGGFGGGGLGGGGLGSGGQNIVVGPGG